MLSLSLLLIGLEWWRSLQAGRRARGRQSHKIAIHEDAWPSVSVLVPAWAEAGIIDACLNALAGVIYPCWEVIIIAGGPDNTYEKVDQMPKPAHFAVIRQGPGGKNAALNEGLALGTGQVIVVLDADSVVGPDWLQALVYPLMNGADATCGNYLPFRRTWVSQTEEMEKTAGCLIYRNYILQGSGSIALWRTVLEQAGGFPASVTTGVDWDLSVRLDKAGRTLAFAENAAVWTHRPSKLSEFWVNEVRWRHAHIRSLLNHRDWFFRNTMMALINGKLYGLIISLGFGLAVGMICFLSGNLPLAEKIYQALILFLVTLAGRKAALAGQIAIYTRNYQWLWLLWAPMLLLLVSIVASWWAILTLPRHTVHFKGPR